MTIYAGMGRFEPMTDMVARLARVLWRVNNAGADYESIDWQPFIPAARAVIAAMREPTDAMMEAGQMSMVERVARVIRSSDDPNGDWTDYESMARAAIAAMREPTPEMMASFYAGTAPLDMWHQMIDAALQSK